MFLCSSLLNSSFGNVLTVRLGTLVRLSARTDPLIKELSEGLASHADPAARLAMCFALGEVLLNVPTPVSEERLQASSNRQFIECMNQQI